VIIAAMHNRGANQRRVDRRRVVGTFLCIVAHEHAHVLQAEAAGVFAHSNKNLLELSLLEGGADFIEMKDADDFLARSGYAP
jgi:hypothetical protein